MPYAGRETPRGAAAVVPSLFVPVQVLPVTLPDNRLPLSYQARFGLSQLPL